MARGCECDYIPDQSQIVHARPAFRPQAAAGRVEGTTDGVLVQAQTAVDNPHTVREVKKWLVSRDDRARFHTGTGQSPITPRGPTSP
jgi:hypothetical protein